MLGTPSHWSMTCMQYTKTNGRSPAPPPVGVSRDTPCGGLRSGRITHTNSTWPSHSRGCGTNHRQTSYMANCQEQGSPTASRRNGRIAWVSSPHVVANVDCELSLGASHAFLILVPHWHSVSPRVCTQRASCARVRSREAMVNITCHQSTALMQSIAHMADPEANTIKQQLSRSVLRAAGP